MRCPKKREIPKFSMEHLPDGYNLNELHILKMRKRKWKKFFPLIWYNNLETIPEFETIDLIILNYLYWLQFLNQLVHEQ